MNLLEIQDLVIHFHTYEGVVPAVDGLSLEVLAGETLGLVGETGCGKTVTALSVLGLIPPPGKVEGGRIVLHRPEGEVDLLTLSQKALQHIRGREIAMIFQEPSAALNPVYTIGDQISESLLLHRRSELFYKREEQGWFHRGWGLFSGGRARRSARGMAMELLRDLEIADAGRIADRYPHELSGGMNQRAVIAMAIACQPRLLIADEPTTSLDVTVQAEILELLRRLKRELGSTILYITHNLGVVAEMCDRVAVMYAGALAEMAEVRELFHKPLHPYSQALLACLPRPGRPLHSIPGSVPNLLFPPPGCRFHPRCPSAVERCRREKPALREVSPGHRVACHLY